MKKEEMFYLECGMDKKIFVHAHFPESPRNEIIFFFKPLFDEAKRAHLFVVYTAKKLAHLGYLVISFDYFGTGDSDGYSHQFDANDVNNQFSVLYYYAQKQFSPKKNHVIGLRFGSYFAAHVPFKMHTYSFVEPVLNCKKYLSLLFYRKKISNKLNNVHDEGKIQINDLFFDDLLGFPISDSNKNFIESANMDGTILNNSNIVIVGTHQVDSKKQIAGFSRALAERNTVKFATTICDSFWFSMEFLDTSKVSDIVANNITIINQ